MGGQKTGSLFHLVTLPEKKNYVAMNQKHVFLPLASQPEVVAS